MLAGRLSVLSLQLCLLASAAAGSAQSGSAVAACAGGGDDRQCSVGTGPASIAAASGGSLTRQAPSAAAAGADHALLQRGFSGQKKIWPRPGGGQECTPENTNPWASGYVACCAGLRQQWGLWSGRWHFLCVASNAQAPEPAIEPTPNATEAPTAEPGPSPSPSTPPPAAECTPEGDDPWSTGEEVACCEGLQAVSEIQPDLAWRYRCRDPAAAVAASTTPAAPEPTAAATTTAAAAAATTAAKAAPSASGDGGSEGLVKIGALNWNVHWTNKDTQGMANIIKESSPDIVGLCEFTVSLDDMAAALSVATGRDFAVQPGRGGWQGYGTDILYDQGKWEALEGGVQRVRCPGTSGGDRAANWAVLRDRDHGRLVVTGGVHLSYCADGCDVTHECELGILYDQLERMKSKYPDSAVLWMGDTNRNMATTVMQNLMQGKIGSRATIALDDLSRAQGNTYYTGGTPIDHILGEAGKFVRISGGLTGQGVTGQHLSGADHFPVRALVQYSA